MPRPDFLRPLVPDPVCKSRDPRSPLPGSTEQTHSVPFSQGPEGSSPCWQGVTPPFFPPPRHRHPPCPSQNPSPEAWARFSLPYKKRSPSRGDYPAPSFILGPYPPLSPQRCPPHRSNSGSDPSWTGGYFPSETSRPWPRRPCVEIEKHINTAPQSSDPRGNGLQGKGLVVEVSWG